MLCCGLDSICRSSLYFRECQFSLIKVSEFVKCMSGEGGRWLGKVGGWEGGEMGDGRDTCNGLYCPLSVKRGVCVTQIWKKVINNELQRKQEHTKTAAPYPAHVIVFLSCETGAQRFNAYMYLNNMSTAHWFIFNI